jgi:hypothetical protein
VNHRTNARFWRFYRALPKEIRELADRNYSILKADPNHASLHFKKIGQLWSARVGLHYRGLATEVGSDLVWFWIGSHADYDKLVGRKSANRTLQPTSRARKKAKSNSRRCAARG